MLNNIKAVIFDMDGTLIDSMWVWEAIDKDYLGTYGVKYSKQFHKDIEGLSFVDTAIYFKKSFNIDKSIDEILNDWHNMACDKYANEVRFKKGAIDFLKRLKNSGIRTGIATSNSRDLVDLFLNNNDANKYFDCVLTSSEIKASKPAPDMYLAVADKLFIPPQECLVFEDIPNGILAGKNAKMHTCAVYDKYSEECDDIKKELADYYINDFTDILCKI